MPTKPEHTVGHIVDRWLFDVELRVDLALVTKSAYRRTMAHLLAWGQHRALARIDLRQYVTARRANGAAPRTLVLELRVIGSVIKWARNGRLIPPTATLDLPRIRVDPLKFEHNHVTPTPNEAARAIAAMDRDDWRLAVSVIARTGARVGEVVNLRSRDLDEPGRRIAFGATELSSKTGMRWFPLDAAGLDDLRGRGGRGSQPLFDFQGRGRSARSPPAPPRTRLSQGRGHVVHSARAEADGRWEAHPGEDRSRHGGGADGPLDTGHAPVLPSRDRRRPPRRRGASEPRRARGSGSRSQRDGRLK